MQGRDKAFISLMVMTVLVTAGFVILVPLPQRQIGQNGSLESFASYDQMKNYVSERASGYQGGIVAYGPALKTAYATMAAAPASPSFTTTNIQVEGVDEPDIVKTDGAYLYVASGSTLSVVRVHPPNGTEVVSKLKYDGQVLGIFLAPSRLVVIESAQNVVNETSGLYSPVVVFMLYDNTNPSALSIVRSVSVNGTYIDSRLTGGYVYAIVQQPAYVYGPEGSSSFAPPSILDGSATVNVDPSNVYYTPNSTTSFGQYTVILSMSVTDGSHSQEAVMTGWGSTIYASTSNIYIAFPDFAAYPMMGLVLPAMGAQGFAAPTFWRGFGGNTTIFRIALSGAGQTQAEAEGMIPGTVLNQFSVDEYNGYLRVATTGYRQLSNQSSVQVNNVYVLDQSLRVVGAVEDLAPSERIYSVRFLGDVGYVVTFERIDPLFAISFADPTRPVVLSSLELTGFSDYLHPIGNGYLIGVGKETVPAPQEQGYVLYLGVKLSLFHVSANGSSAEVSKAVIGDRGSDTPVSSDHHAFVYDATDALAALPVLVAVVGQNVSGDAPAFAYGTPVYQGAFLFRVTTSGIQLLGNLTQVPNGNLVDQSQEYYINRIVIIEGFVYTISNRMVMVSNLSGLSTVEEIPL